MAICEVCGIDYPSKRADSKTCSPACRKAASRLSVTEMSELSGTSLSVTEPQSMYRKCGPIPGDHDYNGDPLPACVPDIIRDRYVREGAEYRATIDRLVSTSIADLLAAGVYMPVWRYQLDSMLTTSAPLSA